MEKGICRHSIIPVRAEPDHRSEMVSQLLFGEHYTIVDISKNGEWLQIETYYDLYKGWLARNQHTLISDDYFDQINHSDYKICTDISSTILFGRLPLTILIGSIIPIADNELFKMEEKLAFTGNSKSLSQKRDTDFIKSVAVKYINVPYLWGGKSPFGIDCSGFTQMVFKIAGFKLPRDSSQQIKLGKQVSFEEIKCGDLVFTHNKEDKIDHVGIVLDSNTVIHSSGKVRVDEIRKEGIYNEKSNSLTHFNPLFQRVL
ncbi:MAG: C40 family peptidase [Cyclobacteriaceae bacterium]|nr:C40 family peptidase [Cyclobacteriaceae bacterium]